MQLDLPEMLPMLYMEFSVFVFHNLAKCFWNCFGLFGMFESHGMVAYLMKKWKLSVLLHAKTPSDVRERELGLFSVIKYNKVDLLGVRTLFVQILKLPVILWECILGGVV